MPAIVRPTLASDVPVLQRVLDATELFPSKMLSDMLAPFLQGQSDTIWLSAEQDAAVCGFCFAQLEQMTQATWNMLAIAVDPAAQGCGFGSVMTATLEQQLRSQGARILIVDTSGSEDFARTREFYLKNGYKAEARIHDFWAAGDDKVTFRKAL